MARKRRGSWRQPLTQTLRDHWANVVAGASLGWQAIQQHSHQQLQPGGRNVVNFVSVACGSEHILAQNIHIVHCTKVLIVTHADT